MSFRSLETKILREAKRVTGNDKLTLRELVDWAWVENGDTYPSPSRTDRVFLPKLGLTVWIRKAHEKLPL